MAYFYCALIRLQQLAAIQVEKTLGAASVGQALLCTFTDAKGNKSEKVVKILRPDVKLRIERERKIFEKAAAEIPGMSQTFQGQLERILDELDLTIEARNVEKGLVSYDDGTFSNLTSMKLDPNVPPTNNVMVLEKAPGTTLSRYIRDMKEQLQELGKAVADAFDDFLLEPRDEERDRLVERLVGLVAEILDRARIDLENVAVRIGDHHRVIHARQELAEERLAVLGNEKCHETLIIPHQTMSIQSPYEKNM